MGTDRLTQSQRSTKRNHVRLGRYLVGCYLVGRYLAPLNRALAQWSNKERLAMSDLLHFASTLL
jgi:hypothetical protein